MNKDIFYFRHDSNARNDEKIQLIIRKYGMEGYGTFWAILESLRESSDYTHNLDYETIAFTLRVDVEEIKFIIEESGLFRINEDTSRFYSIRLLKDMEKWDSVKASRSKAGKMSAEAKSRAKKAGIIEQNINSDTNNTNSQNKEEQDEPKDIKQGKARSVNFVPPSIEEVKAYCDERRNGIDAEQFVAFYTSKGWKVGNTKMKDWKACVITWEKKQNNNNINGTKSEGLFGQVCMEPTAFNGELH